MIVIDALALGVALLVFAFFHHVKSAYFDEIEAVALPTAAVTATESPDADTDQTQTVETTTEKTEDATGDAQSADADNQTAETGDTAEPTPSSTEPEPTPEPTGLLKGKYADKFSTTLVSWWS